MLSWLYIYVYMYICIYVLYLKKAWLKQNENLYVTKNVTRNTLLFLAVTEPTNTLFWKALGKLVCLLSKFCTFSHNSSTLGILKSN